MVKVKSVSYVSDYIVNLIFEDGVSGNVDLSLLVTKGVFRVLQDQKEFAKVYCTSSSIAWSENLEIDSVALYLEITGKKFGEIAKRNLSYATD